MGCNVKIMQITEIAMYLLVSNFAFGFTHLITYSPIQIIKDVKTIKMAGRSANINILNILYDGANALIS